MEENDKNYSYVLCLTYSYIFDRHDNHKRVPYRLEMDIPCILFKYVHTRKGMIMVEFGKLLLDYAGLYSVVSHITSTF